MLSNMVEPLSSILRTLLAKKFIQSSSRGGSRADPPLLELWIQHPTSKAEHFVIIATAWKPLTIITKRTILDVAAALYPPLQKSTFSENYF